MGARDNIYGWCSNDEGSGTKSVWVGLASMMEAAKLLMKARG